MIGGKILPLFYLCFHQIVFHLKPFLLLKNHFSFEQERNTVDFMRTGLDLVFLFDWVLWNASVDGIAHLSTTLDPT
ncbi:hypothetical protein VNO78_27293 [Psophocarpus tetragonolobus]|uniref:Uncharacterized protein n=1 Tax=Psophocarpus tetragonolobus TaxID=3891 RepID=A0AAN9S0L6_PSOTE